MARSKKDTGNWLITYSDLVTLLMVFFVVLFMLTPGIDEDTLNKFLAAFQKSRNLALMSSVVPPENIMLPEQIREEMWQSLTDFVADFDMQDQVELELTPEGIRISLSEAITFDSGSAELLTDARQILAQIASLLRTEIREVEVQGHTDNVPLSPGSRYRSNWDLGAARAVSVVGFIDEHSILETRKFKASSYSEYHPVTTNDSAAGRARNRRVEIYVRMGDGLTEFYENPIRGLL